MARRDGQWKRFDALGSRRLDLLALLAWKPPGPMPRRIRLDLQEVEDLAER